MSSPLAHPVVRLIAVFLLISACRASRSGSKLPEANDDMHFSIYRRGWNVPHTEPAAHLNSPHWYSSPSHAPKAPANVPHAGVIETILGSKTLDKLVKYTSAAASKASKAVPQSAKSAVARDARMTNGWLQQHTPKVLYQAGKGVVSGTTKATKSATRAVRAEMGKQQTRRIVREMAQRGLVPADAASFVGRHTNREEFLAALRTNSPYRGYVSSEARGMHGVAYGSPQHSQPRHHDQYHTHGQPPTYSASASPEYYHAAAAASLTPPQDLASQPLLRSWSRGHDYPHPSSSLFASSPAPSPYTTAPGHQPPPHDIGGGWRPAPAPPGHRRFASPPPGPSVRQKGKGVVID